jgi:hypothetical protein
MSKALVLYGVDFSSVALDQVELTGEIPCTEVSLSPSTLTFDTHEQSAQVTPVLTPSNTTDEPEWASSNDNIATVVNGLVTIHGIGTAVITCTCGSASASITISQTMLKMAGTLYKIEGRYVEKMASYDAIQIGSASNNNLIGMAKVAEDTDLHIRNADYAQCIRVPYGATKVKIAYVSERIYVYKCLKADTNVMVNVPGEGNFPKYLGSKDNFYCDVGADVEYGQCVVFRLSGSGVIDNVSYVYFD